MKKYTVIGLIPGMAILILSMRFHDTFQVPVHWPSPSYDLVRNPLDPAKVDIGHALFYDPVLSRNLSISCASCHSPYNAFSHADHALSHGIDDSIGTRNAPALMNLAWQPVFMWDGAINHLDMQSLFPITHPDEMGDGFEHVVDKLQASERYRHLFQAGWGDSLVTGERVLKSLSQFMLTLVSANAKYDSVMRAETKFTTQELQGYRLFTQHCAVCHTEPLFTSFQFENNGLKPDAILQDGGRINVTHHPGDSLKFKVPTLRNIEYSYPYMHDGRFRTLDDVLNHYTGGIYQTATTSPYMKEIPSLTSNQKVDLIAFLLTLSDRSFIFNPDHTYPHDLLK